MGQYYLICNLDKREFLHAHKFGDGLKLTEFGCSSCGVMSALAFLLSSGNGLGGGDLDSDSPVIGSWSGDRIVIAGDYDDKGKWGIKGEQNLYNVACDLWTDISPTILAAMCQADYIREEILENHSWLSSNGPGWDDVRCALGFSSIIEALQGQLDMFKARAETDTESSKHYQRRIERLTAEIRNIQRVADK